MQIPLKLILLKSVLLEKYKSDEYFILKKNIQNNNHLAHDIAFRLKYYLFIFKNQKSNACALFHANYLSHRHKNVVVNIHSFKHHTYLKILLFISSLLFHRKKRKILSDIFLTQQNTETLLKSSSPLFYYCNLQKYNTDELKILASKLLNYKNALSKIRFISFHTMIIGRGGN